MISAGMDIGSRTVKVVLLEKESLTVLGSGLDDQGTHQERIAEALLERVCQEAGIIPSDIGRVVATGYGRNAIERATTTITEITCQARGVHFQEPDARTIVDIGGQDSKVIHLDENGNVRDFAMNDRCAAGTGRFLEATARQLALPIESLGEAAGRATVPSAISSMCVVFAETEIIGLLAAGASPDNIVAGVQHAIASRISSMAGRRVVSPVIFTGGVAQIDHMDEVIAEKLGVPLKVTKNAQLTGALGAALLAAKQVNHDTPMTKP